MTSTEHATLEHLFAQAHEQLAAGDAHAALAFARQAWELAPREADCSNLIGVCAIALGDDTTALQCWRHAIALNPQTVEARGNLARHFTKSGRTDEAEACLREAIALAPARADFHLLLGHLLAARKDTEAAASYGHALTLDAGLADAWGNLALLLEREKRWNEAEAHHRRALELAPNSVEIHLNLGNLLARLRRSEEAERAYRQALVLHPASAVAYSNLGVLQADLRQDVQAEQSLRHALQLRPGYQLARHNLAMLLLTHGRLEEGWPLFEARHHPDLPSADASLPPLPGRQWQGEPLEGKSLLIWPEQGYGDMIQFCRYVPLMQRAGATRIDLVCRKAQVELLKTLEGVDRVVALDEADAIVGTHDYWALPMSLPLHHGTTLSAIPARLPYLHAPEDRRARWRERLAADGKKIGLAWRGNGHHANDARRSLPDFSLLTPLLSVPGARFYSLQLGTQESLPAQVTDLGAHIDDFADSAAIIEQLDLLITVDTAIAHTAGALGKPCWIMLPAYRSDWRWLRARGDSPWYPGVVRLYRQDEGENWETVVSRIAQDLPAFLG